MIFLKRIYANKFKKNKKEFKSEYTSPTFLKKIEFKPKVRILGDHSDLHCGCQAVIESLSLAIKDKGWEIVGPFTPYNILIVNGEGSMHHDSRNCRMKMQVLQHAIENNIPCFLLNSVWQHNSHNYDSILQKINVITVREILSQIELESKHNIKSKLMIDASYFAPVDASAKTIDFNGKPITTDYYYKRAKKWGPPPTNLSHMSMIYMEQMSWSSFVNSIKTSSFLVTGRHHAVYAACRARIPFIATESNSHKISGLIKSANVNIPIAETPEEVFELTDLIPSLIVEYEKLFLWMDTFCIDDLIPEH